MTRMISTSAGWTPLPQVVARQLQQKILDGEWRTGDQIPSQRILSEHFNVSRASLREALLTLETLGLVKTEPGRGTYVTAGRNDPTEALKWRYSDSFAMADVFETRLMLEGRISANAARVMSPTTLAMLVEFTDEMERCWAAGDLLANVEADLKFHRTIAESCDNKMLRMMYETVQGLLSETQRQPIPHTNPSRMRDSVAEHRQIITAVAAHDADAARDAMRRHVRNTAACAGIAL